jgi:catechol 2,3-dioxygenase-like lactoylglutathione lyase family enzyme
MKLTELAHFTPRVSEMAAFYERLLGTPPFARSDDMAIFVTGQTKIFIHRAYEPGPDDLPPENHTAFAVPDVDAACASAGLALEIEPADYYWGRSAYLRDPDGNLIELTQGG